jgi:hypothetical protein
MKLRDSSNKGFETVRREWLQWRFELSNPIPEVNQIMTHDIVVQTDASDTLLESALQNAPKCVVRVQVPRNS